MLQNSVVVLVEADILMLLTVTFDVWAHSRALVGEGRAVPPRAGAQPTNVPAHRVDRDRSRGGWDADAHDHGLGVTLATKGPRTSRLERSLLALWPSQMFGESEISPSDRGRSTRRPAAGLHAEVAMYRPDARSDRPARSSRCWPR